MKKLYNIYDVVAEEAVGMRMYYCLSFNTDEQAARYFADAINDTTSILNKHPGDYELQHVGEMTDKGMIKGITPVTIIKGNMVLATQQPAELAEPNMHENSNRTR